MLTNTHRPILASLPMGRFSHSKTVGSSLRSELGLIFLLFMIGLELNVEELAHLGLSL